ncbi:MAG TPA: hypothetical protein VI893_00250, partial [Thermoplasmata archaeon]|nr:hypothetical protein [Thermoplasmata archaeon]
MSTAKSRAFSAFGVGQGYELHGPDAPFESRVRACQWYSPPAASPETVTEPTTGVFAVGALT